MHAQAQRGLRCVPAGRLMMHGGGGRPRSGRWAAAPSIRLSEPPREAGPRWPLLRMLTPPAAVAWRSYLAAAAAAAAAKEY
jgi:hypothetical protein